jgi:chromosome segregation ATPase
METAMIIVLLIIAIIFLIILISTIDKNKALNIKNKSYASALDKSKKENGKLKTNNENLKITIDQQEVKFNKLKKSNLDLSNSKLIELEIKYKSSLHKINERDEKIRLLDSKIIELEKTKKEYSQRVYNLQTQRDMAKHEAIDKANQAVEICNEMANKFKSLNSELEAIESQLLGKIKP